MLLFKIDVHCGLNQCVHVLIWSAATPGSADTLSCKICVVTLYGNRICFVIVASTFINKKQALNIRVCDLCVGICVKSAPADS